MGRHSKHKYIWMRVTNDKYEFPLEMADTAKELAKLIGSTENSVISGVCHYERGEQWSSFRKVKA